MSRSRALRPRLSSTLAIAIECPSRLEQQVVPKNWHPWSARSSRSSRTLQEVKLASSRSKHLIQRLDKWKRLQSTSNSKTLSTRDNWEVQLEAEPLKQVRMRWAWNRSTERMLLVRKTTKSAVQRTSKRWFLPLLTTLVASIRTCSSRCTLRLNTTMMQVMKQCNNNRKNSSKCNWCNSTSTSINNKFFNETEWFARWDKFANKKYSLSEQWRHEDRQIVKFLKIINRLIYNKRKMKSLRHYFKRRYYNNVD